MEKPMIIWVLGLPGSGKSYFARHLAKRTGATYISSDSIRKQLFRQPGYAAGEKETVYREMGRQMVAALQAGETVLLDGSFHLQQSRDLIKAEIPQPFRLIMFRIVADEELIRQRLLKPRPFSDADFSVYQLLRDRWEPIQEAHYEIRSTNHNINAMLQEAEKCINQVNAA